MKNFQDWHGHLWQLCFDAERQAFAWRCLGPLMQRDDAAAHPAAAEDQQKELGHEKHPECGKGNCATCRSTDAA